MNDICKNILCTKTFCIAPHGDAFILTVRIIGIRWTKRTLKKKQKILSNLRWNDMINNTSIIVPSEPVPIVNTLILWIECELKKIKRPIDWLNDYPLQLIKTQSVHVHKYTIANVRAFPRPTQTMYWNLWNYESIMNWTCVHSHITIDQYHKHGYS